MKVALTGKNMSPSFKSYGILDRLSASLLTLIHVQQWILKGTCKKSSFRKYRTPEIKIKNPVFVF